MPSILLVKKPADNSLRVFLLEGYQILRRSLSRWWQLKYFLFSSLFGEDEPNLTNIFQMGWFNHQPVVILTLFSLENNSQLDEALMISIESGSTTPDTYLCVLKNIYGCFQKYGKTLQIIHLNRVFHYKPSIWWYPYFWKHPYIAISSGLVRILLVKSQILN